MPFGLPFFHFLSKPHRITSFLRSFSGAAEPTTMAARQAMLKGIRGNPGIMFGFSRCTHSMPQPPPLGGAIDLGVPSTQHVLPESDWNRGSDHINGGNSESSIGFSFPSFALGGSMELMAVPKRKVTPHRRGIRNGPKALKPIPVIIRCKEELRSPFYLEKRLGRTTLLNADKMPQELRSFCKAIFFQSLDGVVVVLSCRTSFVAVGTGVILASKMVRQTDGAADRKESGLKLMKAILLIGC